MRFVLILLLFPFLLTASPPKDITIVIPKNGGQEFLSLSLKMAETMKKSTGGTVNVTTQLQDDYVIPVWLATLEKPAAGRPAEGLDTLGDDGYILHCDGKSFLIAAKTGQGLSNGCNAFLERVCGVRMYAPGMTVIPEGVALSLKPFRVAETPAFTFREIYGPWGKDPEYRNTHCLDIHDDVYGQGAWVHTFNRLVPPSAYFTYHPEYFSEVGGMRVPDGQLCLSNPEVLRVLTENLREFWSIQPDAKAWSVSQNDTYKNCECSTCRRLDSIYGGPSGTMIWFVNQVAGAFPGKEISTLAYQYTRNAPKNIQPADNVTIVLCTIECDRGAPIAERDPGFVKDLADWSKLTSNILIWDYVVQFRNYLDPFPNFAVLQPNLQLFRKYGAKQMFQQASGNSWSDMIELKQYIIAKLLWDPEADVNGVMNEFLEGFYGPGAPYIRQYLDLMAKALKDSGGRLGIYGFPYDGYKTYLTPGIFPEYEELWDKAEEAANDVGRNSFYVAHVQKSRLPLIYARLDISLHNPDPSMSWFRIENGNRVADPHMTNLLDTFVVRCSRFGIKTLDENGTTPEMYKTSVLEWVHKSLTPNLASVIRHPSSVSLASAASEKYPVGGAGALTDGMYGVNDYHFNWLGFEGSDMEAVIDLGEPKPVNEVYTTFLQFNQAWIFLPPEVAISVSNDGKEFSEPVKVQALDTPQKTGSFMQEFRATYGGEPVRYIKVKAVSLKVCPPWHGGHGLPCWIFCDEVVVN